MQQELPIVKPTVKLSKHDQIIRAVNIAKESQFGVKAIKVELEANLNRDCDVEEAHDYMMRRLQDMGLADEGNYVTLHDGLETAWQPLRPLTYCEFYYDGSVDSEFTFTLMLDDPENIFLLPKIVDIWNDFAEEHGTMDIRGAGMHMAFLPGGVYPAEKQKDYRVRFDNFKKSMTMLLPALYFLGASCENSRGLDFRKPNIGFEDHRTAIDYRLGALEFRVFDPCYQNPSLILDNFVVMSRTLKYWRKKYKPGLEKTHKKALFGTDDSNDLDRLYTTYAHLELLNSGLKLLKPGYLTVKEIKNQRKFLRNKHALNKIRKQTASDAELGYREYLDRCKLTGAEAGLSKQMYIKDRVSYYLKKQEGLWELAV